MKITRHLNSVPSVPEKPGIFVIDADAQTQASIGELFSELGIEVLPCRSGEEFLETVEQERRNIVILNTQMVDGCGLDFQSKISGLGIDMPVIFISQEQDVAKGVRGMKAGAVDFLMKPLEKRALLGAVEIALARDEANRSAAMTRSNVMACAAKLTRREYEVLEAVTTGLMNKQIAFNMGISEITVKIHRGRMMRKMNVRSVAELVRVFQIVKPLMDQPTHALMEAAE